ncbi:MAG: helix-turn-helix domain-containing protein [Blautia sp.]|nr:helix-turn-helix domain-containing protein [Blautia sp.]MDY4515088.1 helix-turn-helix transcriptional regulator [Lachnospiraceae bacterium]
MTLGDKLSKLRKENNYTQEQLTDVLGVSRQAVSKWESNITYPETNKLIRMSELFNCSLDYLLKDTEETDSKNQFNEQSLFFRKRLRERKSN